MSVPGSTMPTGCTASGSPRASSRMCAAPDRVASESLGHVWLNSEHGHAAVRTLKDSVLCNYSLGRDRSVTSMNCDWRPVGQFLTDMCQDAIKARGERNPVMVPRIPVGLS